MDHVYCQSTISRPGKQKTALGHFYRTSIYLNGVTRMWLNGFIEVIFSLGLFINALLFIPQIIKLYKTKDAIGFSLITFAGFNIIQLFTALHGFLHNDILLMLGNFISLCTCGIVTGMIIFYKLKAS
jgi:MtN3 and saliva related transmembrane protein